MAGPAQHLFRVRRSLLRRVALIFVAAVVVTALALSLSAYLLTKTAQDQDALDKALAQSRFNLFLADSMLPEAPDDVDYEQLVDAFQIRGDFATLMVVGSETYVSGFDVTQALITSDLAGKIAENRIGYQNIKIKDEPTLVVGGQIRSGQLSLYFFYPQGDRLDGLARLRNILIIAGVVLAVLGAIAGYVLARGLVRPVRAASKAAVQMSRGDLDIRLREGSDEFGILAASFNRMAENLQAKMAALEAGQARERRFVADVTHELRTPVSALVGEASLLKADLEANPSEHSAEIGRLVGLVNSDIARLRELVDDLLEISRLEAQAAETIIEPVDIGAFLAQLLQAHGWSENVQIVAAGPGTGESLGTVEGAGPVSGHSAAVAVRTVAQADRRRLERVLVNLIGNALQHGAPPVMVKLGQSGTSPSCQYRFVQITVDDCGPGIPIQHLPHVFDRFYKADPSRSSSRGSGLGLAIARENARLLGGDITVTNKPGGGASFVLTLPAVD